MNHMSFDPYLMIRQRHEEILQEVHALQLGERLSANRKPRGLWFLACGQRGALPILRKIGLTG